MNVRRALLLLLLLPAATLRADPARFASVGRRVSLIELYTSEGCSSCPPADRWLAGLRSDPGLWTRFVPVEFHVTFWDYLGWRDRLSRPAYTDRERAYAASWGSSSIYTPCFVRDGSEWRPDWGGRQADAAGGRLEIEYAAGNPCRVTYAPPAPTRGSYTAHVALLGGGISSRVTAGENSGETLSHEFVVLSLGEARLVPGGGGSLSASVELPAPSIAGAPRMAVAAWVSREGGPEPAQAAGGWLSGQ